MAVKAKNTEIDVVSIRQGEVTFYILGAAPFYCNRVAEKAKRELLMPKGRMTQAQKATNLKHDPEAEYRNSPYLRRGPGPTRIMMRSDAFKKAIAQAAIDMPTGVAKAQINRLTYVVGDYVPIWGLPRLSMEIVRSADMARTPDVRTRARIDRWAAVLQLRYCEPMLNADKVTKLLSAAGVICGVGDWRQEKGGGSNGLFDVVAEDDPRLLAVLSEGGIEAQDEALARPVCSDPESEDLLAWYHEELGRRGVQAPEAEDEDEIVTMISLNGEDRTEVAH